MSKTKLTKPQIRQAVENIVEGLKRDHSEEVLGAVRQILAEQVSRPKGRRVDPNWSLYQEMARTLASGKTSHVIEAARMVAHRVIGGSEDTAVGTLRKNYSRYREELEAELRAESARGREDLKDPILEVLTSKTGLTPVSSKPGASLACGNNCGHMCSGSTH